MKHHKDDLGEGLSRRKFVQLGSLGMLTLGMAACSDSDRDGDDTDPPAEPSSNRVTVDSSLFPQSVASGDPRPDSMIFWTRVQPGSDQDAQVQLIVATDDELRHVVTSATLTATAEFDHVVKLKLMQLEPYTTYYYQFQYNNGTLLGSKVGRTKTAPTPDMDVKARFAVLSCQDYRDRYYNTLAELGRRDDLDFVVHLGDYIYETTVSIASAKPDEGRSVAFSRPEEAIELPGGTLAARSLSNYRDLYKIYRSDPTLQRVHERHPMISTWDDHEFSNDAHGDSGTYFDGARNEQDTQRRHDSERVYAEFMPMGFGLDAAGNLTDGTEGLFPNTRIYRDFEYGQHLHLILTDTRTFRPDHLIPEDAFPGTVAVDQPTLEAFLGAQGIPFSAVAENFAAYVNMDAAPMAPYKQALTAVLTQALLQDGLTQEAAVTRAAQQMSGNIAVVVANPMLTAYNSTLPPQPLPLLEEAGQPRGLAYALLGKTANNTNMGSRYFVVKETYDLLASLLYQASGGASENILGTEQETWLENTLAASTATWRVLANSIPMASMVLDLSDYPVPETFRRAFYVTLDQWDGFRNKRRALLDKIAELAPQTALIAGDVHSNLVAKMEHGLFEFTGGAVSSATMKEFMLGVTNDPPFNSIEGVGALLAQVNKILLNSHPKLESGERSMKFVRADAHAYMIMEAGPDGLGAFYNLLPENLARVNLYDDVGLSGRFERIGFRLTDGKLTQEF